MASASTATNIYRTIWRWHFYAGLFVMPFIVILALSGTLYLFKPQIERWEERDFRSPAGVATVLPHQQLEAAMAAYPGAQFLGYRLPERPGDSALIQLSQPAGAGPVEVFVGPEGKVAGSLMPEDRIMALVLRVHSELLAGTPGNRLVELAASWVILMILSGLYLWWPRGGGAAGVVWPRLGRGSRVFWRDLHAVTGFWISGLALILLLTGLPWTEVWGGAFKAARQEFGWVKGASTWQITHAAPDASADPHAGHGMVDEKNMGPANFAPQAFDAMVARARAEGLAFPAIVTPPGAPGRFGQPGEPVWTIRSDALNVPLQQTIRFDSPATQELSRERFADEHVVDRVVGYGIAWHQGQLFGPLNQLIGVLTALGLVTMAVSGFVMWRRRKPAGRLGAPPAAQTGSPLIMVLLIFCALLLPLVAASVLLIWFADKLLLPRIPKAAEWLGVRP
ncbi:PepSY-associated TM helix domain-containing protein [Sandaracinobacteroides hominis]|uniref:PepSY-associated TM helix domain-containing protein n=1 Tax=Sandaracinobacteroides hominis TaxID=2780086 RepID=UPI001F34AC17|nr:PepSY domain-containing protein [Sandaracinobacteroides hominis]